MFDYWNVMTVSGAAVAVTVPMADSIELTWAGLAWLVLVFVYGGYQAVRNYLNSKKDSTDGEGN